MGMILKENKNKQLTGLWDTFFRIEPAHEPSTQVNRNKRFARRANRCSALATLMPLHDYLGVSFHWVDFDGQTSLGIHVHQPLVVAPTLETHGHFEEVIWLRVKNRYPTWNPCNWKHGPKPVVFWWLYFDPYPSLNYLRACRQHRLQAQLHVWRRLETPSRQGKSMHWHDLGAGSVGFDGIYRG